MTAYKQCERPGRITDRWCLWAAVRSAFVVALLGMLGCSAPVEPEPQRDVPNEAVEAAHYQALKDSLATALANKDLTASARLTAALIRSPYARTTFETFNFAHGQRWFVMSRVLNDPRYPIELDSMLAQCRASDDTLCQFVLLTQKVQHAHWVELNTGREMRFIEEALALDPQEKFLAQDHTLIDRYAEACSALGAWQKALEAALRVARFGQEEHDCEGEYWGLIYASEAYGQLGLRDSCYRKIEEALALIASCGAASTDPYCYSSLAQQERLNGRYDHIPALLDSAEVVGRRAGWKPYECAYCIIERAWWLLHQGRPQAAVDMALMLERSPSWDKRETFHKEFHEVLDSAYLALGDFRRAYEQHAKYEALLRRRELTTASSNLANMESRAREAVVAQERREERLMEAARLHETELVRNGFMVGFLFVALFAVVFLFQRNRINKEKQRSEELLLNILPGEVAEELKAKGSAQAVYIDQVTVLFTDFKGFTAMSEMVTPQQLVHDLHECFSAFDAICGKYGIEKIKTIGDAYMAAGGLPTPNTTHAVDVIKAAFEMRDFIAEGKARKIAERLPYFEVRIGIHTGPVVAGIVGVKKFQYDIWGDTVNTASRMESSGEVGQVNISEATYELVRNESGLTFTPRCKVQAKGKGEMDMYFAAGGSHPN